MEDAYLLCPIVPKLCGNPDCKDYHVIYPSDEKFYKCIDGFYYCCEKCLEHGSKYNKEFKLDFHENYEGKLLWLEKP